MALEYKNNNQKSVGKSGKLCNLKSLSAQDLCKRLFVILSSGVNSSAEYPAPAEYSFAAEYFIPMGCLVPMEYSVKAAPCSCSLFLWGALFLQSSLFLHSVLFAWVYCFCKVFYSSVEYPLSAGMICSCG